MTRKKKGNPSFVTLKMCNKRHSQLDKKVTDILYILKGKPNQHDDLGLLGDIRDIKRDRKWIYVIVTILGVPSLILLLSWLLGGG